MDTEIIRLLEEAGISYQLRPHSRPVFTVEEAAQERGVRPSQLVKVMIARTGDSRLIAVLVPGDRRLELVKLRKAIGDPHLRLASPREIETALGLQVGAISPLNVDRRVPLYIDRRILDEEDITISSGDPHAGLLLSSKDLLNHLSGELGDFS